MDSKRRLEFYKERFYFELGRKDQLKNGVTLPLGLITLLLGSLEYFIVNSSKIPSSFIKILVGLLIIGMCCFLIHAGYLLWKSYYKHTYDYIPNCRNLEKYWLDLNEYYKEYPHLGNPEQNFETFLIDEFINDADKNIELNNKRSNLLLKVNTKIIFALILAFITFTLINFTQLFSWTQTTFSPIFIKKVVTMSPPTPKPTPTPAPPKPPDTVHITDAPKKGGVN